MPNSLVQQHPFVPDIGHDDCIIDEAGQRFGMNAVAMTLLSNGCTRVVCTQRKTRCSEGLDRLCASPLLYHSAAMKCADVLRSHGD